MTMADPNNDTLVKDGEFLVKLANEMLSHLHVQFRVNKWQEIGAFVFITLFEGLWGESLPDVIHQPRSKEDEIHNCQAVIDTLSLDVLSTSLSHITGESVVAGDQDAIGHLLDIFSGLLDYILNRISSDISSTDNEEDRGDLDEDLEDPDLVTAEVIDDILERELGRGLHTDDLQRSRRRETNSTEMSQVSQNTSELIALGDSHYDQHSPPRRGPRTDSIPMNKPFSEGVGKASMDSTVEFPGEKHLSGPKIAWGTGNKPTHEKWHAGHRNYQDLSSQVPAMPAVATDQEIISSGRPLHDALDTSMSSSVSMPKPVVQSNSGSLDSVNSEFNSLGMRPRPQGAQLSSDPPLISSKGHPNPHQTITHHVYHHYDGHSDGKKTVNGTLSSALPLSSSIVNQTATLGTRRVPSGARQDLASSLPLPDKQPIEVDRFLASEPANIRRGRPAMTQSYDNLETLVQDTIAMSRAAVGKVNDHIPDSSWMLTSDLDDELGDVLRKANKEAKKILQHTGIGSDDNTSRPKHKDSNAQCISSTEKHEKDRSKQKVSFLAEHPSVNKSSIEKKGKKHKHLSGCIDLHDHGSAKNSTVKTVSKSSVSNHKQKKTPQQPSSQPVRGRGTGTVLKHPLTVADELYPRQQSNFKPKSFNEYLQKYYGTVEARDYRHYSTDSAHSDTEVDYREESIDDSIDREVRLADLDSYHERIRRGKSVRFEDVLDDSAPGEMGGIRRKLREEEVRARTKSEVLGKIYKHELDDFEEELCNNMKTMRASAKEKEDEYKKKVLSRPKTSKFKPSNKFLACHTSVLKPRGRSKKRLNRGRKHSVSASPSFCRKRSPVRISDNDIIPWLLEEFPYLQLSKETLHELWRKSSRQIEQLSKAQQEVRKSKSRSQIEVEEAERRQQILTDIMRKEMMHNERMRELQARQKAQASVKSHVRDKRIQSARARRYYDDYQIRHRSKMLKKRAKEEVIFKQLFRDGLDIQKERIRELRKYARDQRQQRVERQKNELHSMENYYRDQFSMLTEAMAKEREDLAVREKAQAKVLQQMKRELRHKMEHEITGFQEQLYRDEDEEYFRQLDAERLKQQLHMARYQARV